MSGNTLHQATKPNNLCSMSRDLIVEKNQALPPSCPMTSTQVLSKLTTHFPAQIYNRKRKKKHVKCIQEVRILLSLVLFKFSSEWSVIIYHLNIAKKKKKKTEKIFRNPNKQTKRVGGKNNTSSS